MNSIGKIRAVRLLKYFKGFQEIRRSLNFKTRNPPEPHYDRKRMLEVCKPVYIQEKIPEHLTCKNSFLTIEEPHPFEVILSKELTGKINESKMILIYHVNSLRGEEHKNVYRTFYKENLFFHIYNPNVLKLALEDTKYQALLKLFESSSGLVFGPEVTLSKALKISKQLNDKIVLLAGIIEDNFYSTSHLTAINQLFKRNIHGEMVQNISAPSESICRSVNHHLSLLSHYLSEISKGEKE